MAVTLFLLVGLLCLLVLGLAVGVGVWFYASRREDRS
jgi:hypothetical protein